MLSLLDVRKVLGTLAEDLPTLVPSHPSTLPAMALGHTWGAARGTSHSPAAAPARLATRTPPPPPGTGPS